PTGPLGPACRHRRASATQPRNSAEDDSQGPARLGVPPMSKVTRIWSALEEGDPTAAEQLLPLVYGELRKLANADPQAAELVKLRYFARLSITQAAAALGLSPAARISSGLMPAPGCSTPWAAAMPRRRPGRIGKKVCAIREWIPH